MSKKQIKKDKIFSSAIRENIYREYYSKFYNLFMSKYEIEGLDYQQSDFLMRKFWSDGTCAAWKIKNTDILGLAMWAPMEYNYLDAVAKLTLVNNRGAMFIPTTPMEVDKDVVIGWCQKNHKSIKEYIEIYCSKLADVEMTIRTNLKAAKTPWIMAVSEGNEEKCREFANLLDSDEPLIYLSYDEDSLKPESLISGAQYIIDKLYAYKEALLSEVYTFLGINNLGSIEKKEHLTNAEVYNNNQLIASSDDNFTKPIEEFFERIKETLGFTLTLKQQNYFKEDMAMRAEEDTEDVKD